MTVVLNIGTRDIRLMAARETKIQKWERVSIPGGLVSDGQIQQPGELARVIDELFNKLKVSRERVVVCVEGLSYTYRTLNLPRLASPLMEEAIERAAQKEIPLLPEEIYLDWMITSRTGDEVEVFIIGAPRSMVDAVVETMKLARVGIQALGLKSLALARASGKTDAIIVDFEPDCFDITILSAGVPVIMHTVTPRGETSSLEDDINQLIGELNRTIDFHNITHTRNPIVAGSPLLLSGSLAQEETVAGPVGRGTGHPVETLTVCIPVPDELPVAVFAGAIGLVLKGVVPRKTRNAGADKYLDINIDLLKGRRRVLARRAPAKRSSTANLVFLLLVLLLIPLYFARNNAAVETNFLKTDLERISSNLYQARVQADSAVQIQADIQKLQTENANLLKSYGMLTGKRETSNLVEFMAYTLPAGASYTNIEAGTDGLSITGEAAALSDIIDYVTKLEKFSRFTSVRIAHIENKADEKGKSGGIAFIVKAER